MNRLGEAAEAAAAAFLTGQGLRILARNFQCRFGELDIVAMEGDMIVFVEVRHRASSAFGGALESITLSKQRKLARTAEVYLQGHAGGAPCRFDAVLVEGKGGRIEWIRNAFCT